MPGLFIFAIILAVVGLLGVGLYGAVKLFAPADDPDAKGFRRGAMGFGMFFLVGALFATLASSFNSVGTYDIGVTTNFGKVISYVGPGAHWIAPWENMSLMDESVQTVNDTITVRVAGQQTAQATVRLRVQLVPSATDALFKQYKGNTQNVINALVEPELNVALNGVYDGYDPILPLSTDAAPGTVDNPTTGQLSARVKSALTTAIGTQVKVDTLVVQPLRYDQTVENRINTVLAQTAKTDVAKQSIVTAEDQARANKALQQNVTPLTLVQQCMTAIADGQLNPPAGFSCWPGSGSGVVIPSGK
jgi:regulator of protease activity HflC (stomatin/prohibitin superfamily)